MLPHPPAHAQRTLCRGALALGMITTAVVWGGPGTGSPGDEAVGRALAAPAAQTGDAATAAGLTVDVRPLFDGWYDERRWVPLAVDLKHAGDDMQMELRAGSTGTQATFNVPVELPRGAEKRVPVLLLPGNATRARLAALQDGRPLTERSTELRKTEGEPLIVVIAERDAVQLEGLGQLGRSDRSVVVRAGAADLPEHALGWGSVDAVVLAGADLARASEAGRTALAQWVALGGELVVTGGTGAGAALDTLPDALRPAAATGIRVAADFGALGVLVDGTAPVGSAPIAVLDPTAGTAPIAPLADGTPLAVQRRYGEGVVVALAFDPSLPPFEDWGGLDDMWAVLHVERGETVWTTPIADPARIGSGLFSSPEFALPSMGWLLLLIGVYIVLVGPVNYVVLRRRRRLDLAWVTIPALTVLATGATYGAGYAIHGRDLVLYELSIVHVVPDAQIAYVQTFIGLFSPASQAYDVHIPGGLARPSGDSAEIEVVQGSEGAVRRFQVDQWSVASLAAEAIVDWPAEPPGGLTVNRGRAEGSVRNPFGVAVADARLMVPGAESYIGDLDAAATHDAKRGSALEYVPGREVILGTGPGDWVDDPNYIVRAGIANAALGDGSDDGVYIHGGYRGYQSQPTTVVRARLRTGGLIMGWTRDAPLDVDVADRFPTRRVHTLVYASVPLAVDEQARRIVVGTATERIDASERFCGPEGAIFVNDTGPGSDPEDKAEFRFLLGPQEQVLAPVRLQLNGPRDVNDQVIREVAVAVSNCEPGADWVPVGDEKATFTAGTLLDLPPIPPLADGRLTAICVRLDAYGLGDHYYPAVPGACWEPWLDFGDAADMEPGRTGPVPAGGSYPYP